MIPLSSTKPSDIANSARCFTNCLGGSSQASLKTYLLTQTADIATPPCVTPTAPGQPVAFQTLNNILKIRWTQPANTGSLITSYTISWGTTQGGPYTSSETIAGGGTRQAVLNGLNAGTTYFFVVVANSFAGCSSASSAEGSAATTGAPPICNSGVTFANAWATQVVANGGAAPSQSTINAIANFQCGLITDGLDTLMLAWNAVVPDNFTAATTPQLQGTGFALWQPTLLSGADLTINGLTGGAGGSVRYLKTGIAPNAIFPSVNNTGMTLYVFQSQNSANETTMGCGDAGPTNFYTMYDELSGLKYYQEAGAAMTDAGQFNGYISGSRTAANAKAWYKANSVTPHALIASSAAAPVGGMAAQDFWIFTFNQAGVPVAFSSATLSFIAFHKGLTQAQSALFFARIQALRTALGGGFQ